jgi:nickel/cobalt transporter (NiCoT) family protein
MSGAVLAVLVIGLRHGADPDHLAAIDNLTRNCSERMPRGSRFVGTLFALGHAAMVLTTATGAALLGARIEHVSAALERAGAIASIVVLLLMAALNLVTLARGARTTFRARLLPRRLREATHPLVAVPTGALFGLGFETSSQLLAYGAAFSSAHAVDGLLLGAAFCLGMICTDTVDSVVVARIIGLGDARERRARRMWIGTVTAVALAVAVQESLALLGFPPPIEELALSAITVALIVAAAFVIGMSTRARRDGAAS